MRFNMRRSRTRPCADTCLRNEEWQGDRQGWQGPILTGDARRLIAWRIQCGCSRIIAKLPFLVCASSVASKGRSRKPNVSLRFSTGASLRRSISLFFTRLLAIRSDSCVLLLIVGALLGNVSLSHESGVGGVLRHIGCVFRAGKQFA